MSSILKVRKPNGEVVEVLAIKGKDGYTPVKGVDFFTESDKQEIVERVLASMPSAEGVKY